MIGFGNQFHIDNLAMRYVSKVTCGERVRYNHLQIHHQQYLQHLYDIYIYIYRMVILFRLTNDLNPIKKNVPDLIKICAQSD